MKKPNPQKSKPKTSGMKPTAKQNSAGVLANAKSKLTAMKEELKKKKSK